MGFVPYPGFVSCPTKAILWELKQSLNVSQFGNDDRILGL